MRTIQINLYKFEELSPESQEKTLNALRLINIYPDWYNHIYEDAEQIGMKINNFDLQGRGRDIDFDIKNVWRTKKLIRDSREQNSDEYELTQIFNQNIAELIQQLGEDERPNAVKRFDSNVARLEKQFKSDLGEIYLTLLEKDYEYRISNEQVKDTIIGIGYEFLQEGGEIYSES